MSRFRLLITVCFAALFAAGAFTLQAPPAPTASATVKSATELVLVPVVVSDKKSSFMHGLTKEHFRVEENGKPQTIAIFEEVNAKVTPVRRTKLPNDAYTNEVVGDPNAKPLYIVLVDVLNTSFENQVQGRQALLKMMAQN